MWSMPMGSFIFSFARVTQTIRYGIAQQVSPGQIAQHQLYMHIVQAKSIIFLCDRFILGTECTLLVYHVQMEH